MKTRRPHVLVLGLVAALLGLTPGETAQADRPPEVDQSLLVPTTLDSSFAPFDCKLKRTGPVCTGERHIDGAWGPTDFSCEVPLSGRYESDRYTTRYYDHDYLNYDRRFRSKDIDYLSAAPTGPATATISTNVRFREPFAVPGDDSTFTVITQGVILDVKPVNGRPVLRVVGTLIEPPSGPATFTGHVTEDGRTTTYRDALFDDVFTFETFEQRVCQATIGG